MITDISDKVICNYGLMSQSETEDDTFKYHFKVILIHERIANM